MTRLTSEDNGIFSVPNATEYFANVARWKSQYNGTVPGDEISDVFVAKLQISSFIVAMFGMGLATNGKEIIISAKKLAYGATVGLICQFLIMPCIINLQWLQSRLEYSQIMNRLS